MGVDPDVHGRGVLGRRHGRHERPDEGVPQRPGEPDADLRPVVLRLPVISRREWARAQTDVRPGCCRSWPRRARFPSPLAPRRRRELVLSLHVVRFVRLDQQRPVLGREADPRRPCGRPASAPDRGADEGRAALAPARRQLPVPRRSRRPLSTCSFASATTRGSRRSRAGSSSRTNSSRTSRGT